MAPKERKVLRQKRNGKGIPMLETVLSSRYSVYQQGSFSKNLVCTQCGFRVRDYWELAQAD